MDSEEYENRITDADISNTDVSSRYPLAKVQNISPSSVGVHSRPDQATRKSESPSEKCAICLCSPENRSYTDSCFHEFCFVCLLEWSKVKTECPLCKLKFKNIIHNIRSMSDFDEFEVKEPQRQTTGGREIERVGRGNVSVNVNSPLFGLDESGRRFRYNSTMTAERQELISHIRSLQSHLRELHRSQRDELRVRRQRERLERLAHIYIRSVNRPDTLGSSLEFRRMIYERGLYVRPMRSDEQQAPEDVENSGDAGQSFLIDTYRDTSPEFYRENPAQLHRLLRWLHRELNVFFHGRPNQVNFICNYMCDLISRFDLRSDELRRRLRIIFRQYIDHFLHEFYHFARSPMEMDQYDRFARYERPPGQNDNNLPSISASVNLPNPPLSTIENTADEGGEEPELLSVSSSSSPIVEESSSSPSTPSGPPVHEPSALTIKVGDNLARLRGFLNNARDRLTCLQDAATSSSSIDQQEDLIVNDGNALPTETVPIPLSSSSSPDFSYRRSFNVSPSLSSASHYSRRSEIIFTEPGSIIGSQSPPTQVFAVSRPSSTIFSPSHVDDVTPHTTAMNRARTASWTSDRESRDGKNVVVYDEDDDSDGIEIVAELLPKHLRTQEVLEIDSSLSSSDSDINVTDDISPPRNSNRPCCSKSLKEEDIATDRIMKKTLRSVVLATEGFLRRNKDSDKISSDNKEERRDQHKRKKRKPDHRSESPKNEDDQHRLKKSSKRSRSREKHDFDDCIRKKKHKKYSKRCSNSD
uniref:E3 ubiquitin-protein ligase Topors n=1 Tax=Romanomermis culicivorax TaxID=13658 RepID=A0A915KGV6_ROMCU